MAEIIQFTRVPCAIDDLDNAVEAMKEGFGSNLGGFALVCWSRDGLEDATAYTSGPYDPESLPLKVGEALYDFIYEDAEDEGPANSNSILSALIDKGIIRDDETPA